MDWILTVFLGRTQVAKWHGRNGLHGEDGVAPSHGRACAGVFAFSCVECGMYFTGVWSTSASTVQVCTVYESFLTSVYISENTSSAGRVRALVYAQFFISIREHI